MSTERDELAKVIESGYSDDPTDCPYDHAPTIADAILAAGYTKPRQVTTAEELDTLPEGTVIRDASGVIRDRFNESETDAALWLRPGASGWMLSRNFCDKHFPATVLYSPVVAP